MKKQINLLGIITTIAILFGACGKDTTLKQQEIPITGKITRIYIEGPWEVVITQDSTNNSTVLEYDVPEKKIKTEYFNSGILRIKVYSLDDYHQKTLRIKISATALWELEACDGAKIQANGKFKSYSEIYLSGASQLNGFWCEGAHTRLVLSGASQINNFTYIGTFFNAHVTEASKVNVQNLQMSTSRGCKVNLFSGAEFSASGHVSGTPSFFGIERSVFRTFDLEAMFLDVDFSGGVSAEVTATHEIKGKLAWGSKLKYKKATDVSGVFVDEYSEITKIE